MLGIVRRYGFFISGLLLVVSPRLGWAQARHLLNGLVRGADGTALPGATVAVPALGLGLVSFTIGVDVKVSTSSAAGQTTSTTITVPSQQFNTAYAAVTGA